MRRSACACRKTRSVKASTSRRTANRLTGCDGATYCFPLLLPREFGRLAAPAFFSDLTAGRHPRTRPRYAAIAAAARRADPAHFADLRFARGCAAAYTFASAWKSRFVYTCVLEIDAWPRVY